MSTHSGDANTGTIHVRRVAHRRAGRQQIREVGSNERGSEVYFRSAGGVDQHKPEVAAAALDAFHDLRRRRIFDGDHLANSETRCEGTRDSDRKSPCLAVGTFGVLERRKYAHANFTGGHQVRDALVRLLGLGRHNPRKAYSAKQ
jgi:hypothetical protein